MKAFTSYFFLSALLFIVTSCGPYVIDEYFDVLFNSASQTETLSSNEHVVYIDYKEIITEKTKVTVKDHYRQFQFRLNLGNEIGEAIFASSYNHSQEINPHTGSISLMIHIPANVESEPRQLSVDVRVSSNWTNEWDVTTSKESVDWEEWKTVYKALQSGR